MFCGFNVAKAALYILLCQSVRMNFNLSEHHRTVIIKFLIAFLPFLFERTLRLFQLLIPPTTTIGWGALLPRKPLRGAAPDEATFEVSMMTYCFCYFI